MIGHNPGLQDLALRLAPGCERLVEKFPTGALAAFELDVPNWRELGQTEARLAAYVVPRDLLGLAGSATPRESLHRTATFHGETGIEVEPKN